MLPRSGTVVLAAAAAADGCAVPADAEQQFDERGYFIVRRLLDADAVLQVHDEVGRILGGYAKGNSDGFTRDLSRTDGRELDGPASVRVVRDPRCQSSVLWDSWLTHPNVNALQRRMLGDDVRVLQIAI